MIFFTLFFSIQTSSKSLSYSDSSLVTIYIDEIGTPNKPLSYISFSSFQCCQSSSNQPSSTLSDIFFGHKLTNVGILANFAKDTSSSEFCSQALTEKQFHLLTGAIQNNLSYRFVADDLEYFVPIGRNDNNYNLQYYSEYSFNFLYNNGNIVKFAVSGNEDSLKQLQFKGNYDLSFNVHWKQTTIASRNRFTNFYMSYLFLNDSIQNKIILQLIVQLTILLIIIYLIYNQMMADFEISNQTLIDFDEFEQKTKDKGWKMLHGDIFRSPDHTTMFSILTSSGSHFFHTLFFTLILCSFYNLTSGIEKVKDSLFNTFLIAFILTSFMSGFTATTMSYAFAIRQWLRLVLGGVYMFPFVAEVLILFANFFKNKDISFLSLLFFILILLLPVSFIATLGGVFANRKKLFSKNPCQVALVPRQLPKLPWYLSDFFVCLLIGLFITFSFSSQLFFILQSVFLDQVFNHYFSFFVSFVLICLLSVCSVVVAVYFRLQEEYYKWHWISFIAPASSSLFVFIFCIVFYHFYDVGNTTFQLISYICSSTILSLLFGLVVGFAGHAGTSLFVRVVFSNLKLD